MKRLSLIFLFMLTVLHAFEFNVNAWGNYLTFEPEEREDLLSYPASWLRPGSYLFEHDYQDSSSTYALWEQILATDENTGYEPGMSNRIIVKYIPYSYPHRWSAGLGFINYKGGNSTYRTDAVLHYRQQKGELEYYHTSNTQKITLSSGDTEHAIRTHGLDFDYFFNDKLSLDGRVNINLIDQSDNTGTRNYDIHHERIALNYSVLETLKVYGKFDYWYYHNVDRQGSLMLFFPGLRYNSNIFEGHVSFRISPTTIHPIVELSLLPGPFYFNAFTKARSIRLDLEQPAHQYAGVKTGIDMDSQHHRLTAGITYTYDIVRENEADTLSNHDFNTFRAKGEYRFKTKSLDLYTRGYYQHAIDPQDGYYHPVRSILTGGLSFRTGLAGGKLMLNGDLNAQYILHDDPDLVSFDPSTLIYTLNGAADLIGDWKVNAKLKAIIQRFAISAEITIPVKYTDDLWYFYNDGISMSSDLYTGNALYAGLTIEWLWWK